MHGTFRQQGDPKGVGHTGPKFVTIRRVQRRNARQRERTCPDLTVDSWG